MKNSTPVIYVSAAALVNPAREVLLAQRPQGKNMAGLWEFPGGKIEPGETPEAALVRELREELGIAVEERDLHPLTFVSHAYDTFHLFMPVFTCDVWQGDMTPQEGQAVVWAGAATLRQYDMPPADIPLIVPLQAFLQKAAA